MTGQRHAHAALVLRPLPGVDDGGRVVRLERIRPDGEGGFLSASYPLYRHLRDHPRALDVAAYSKIALTLSAGGQGTAVYGNVVSGNFFSVLGVRPALGRFFAPDERDGGHGSGHRRLGIVLEKPAAASDPLLALRAE